MDESSRLEWRRIHKDDIDRLRQPVENQAEVDRLSAELLRASTCPQCDTPIITRLNRCSHCEGE
jgi:hypothetical protein